MSQTTAKADVSILAEPAQFRVESAPGSAHDALRDSLSYEDPDAQWSDAYQRGHWDGKHHLYDRTEHTAPIGLLARSRDLLESKGYSVSVTDERDGAGQAIETAWNFPHELREYQREAVGSALDAGGGIVSLPTGGGKTVVALRIIHSAGRSAVIFVHSDELLRQWGHRVRDVLDVEPGIIGGGEWSESSVTVATMQTLAERGTDDIGEYGVAVYDEAHRTSAADTFHEVGQEIDAPFRLGLSATPWRSNPGEELKIEGAIGGVAFEVSAEELIEAGYLARPEWRVVDPDDFGDQATANPSEEWQSTYRRCVVECGSRNRAAAETASELANDGRTVLVSVEQIGHGKRLTSLLTDTFGCSATFLQGDDDTDRRERVFEAFESGDVDVLVTTLVKEGVDLPNINAVVLAAGKKSEVVKIQTIGRSLRPENGDDAVIVDFRDRGRYLGEHFEHRQEAFRDYYGRFGPGVDPEVQKVREFLESKSVDTDPLTISKDSDGSVRIEITGPMDDDSFYHYTSVRRDTDGMHFDPDEEVNRVPDPDDLPDSGEW